MEGFERILKTLIVENPDATNAVDLSNLHGYDNLSKGLQEFVVAHVEEVLGNGESSEPLCPNSSESVVTLVYPTDMVYPPQAR